MLCLEHPVFPIVRSSGYRLDSISGKLYSDSRTRAVEKQLTSLQSQVPDFAKFLTYYLERFPLTVRYASGDDIHEVFESYRPGSCMRYSEKRHLREFYANNPDKIGVFYNAKTDHPLLTSDWSALVYIGNSGKLYIDRIYSSGFCHNSMKGHIASAIVRSSGKAVKSIQDSWGNNFPTSGNLTMTFDHDSSEPLPYLDSFGIKSYTSGTVTLTTDSNEIADNCDDVDGTCPDGSSTSRYTCCCCRCRLEEDDYRVNDNGDIHCESCYSDNYAFCEYSDSDCPVDDVNNVTVYYARSSRSNPICELWICDDSLRDDFTETANGSCVEYVHDNDRIELIDGDYICPADYENGDFTYSEYDDEYMRSEDATYCEDIEGYRQTEYCTEHNGQWYGDENNIPVEESDWEEVNITNPRTASPERQGQSIPIILFDGKSFEVCHTNGIFAVVDRRDNLTEIIHLPSKLRVNRNSGKPIGEYIRKLDYIVSVIPTEEIEFLATMKESLSQDGRTKCPMALLHFAELDR